MNQAASAAPPFLPEHRQQLASAFALLQQGRVDDAAALSKALMATLSGNPEVLYLASEVQLAGGEPEAALQLVSAALDAAPDQLPLLLKKVNHLLLLRRRDEVRALAAEWAAKANNSAQTLWAIGRIHSLCDDPASASRFYREALQAAGGPPALRYDLAAALFFTGDFAGAEAQLDSLLAAPAPMAGAALYLRATLRRQTTESNHVADLQARLRAGTLDTAGRAACGYALAKELEDLQQHDASFAALREAAAQKRSTLRYDAATERSTIDAIRQAFTADVMQRREPGCAESGPVFIVGMPRSGTTLLERMLSCHGDVSTAGELLDFGQALAFAARRRAAAEPGLDLVHASTRLDFAALGHDYIEGARQAAPATRLFIDKLPVNFMYCGLIRKALPQARIIHLVRDPMDSCYAAFKTLFHQAYPFSYELAELADYFITYRRLMQHWHQVMPGEILDVRYEDLVADTEQQLRRVLDWCELDFQPAVLDPAGNTRPSTTASAAQVREPVHARSVHKWRAYQTGLAPLMARLQAAGVVDQQGQPLD